MGYQAMVGTGQRVESALESHRAFEKVDDFLFIVKQGSTLVSIKVMEMGRHVVVRFNGHLLKRVRPSFEMAMKLLGLNAVLKFGAFSYVPTGDLVLFSHTLLGGETLDEEEVVTAVEEVAETADKWDNKFADLYGGSTMEEVVQANDLDSIIKDIENVAMMDYDDRTRGRVRSFLRTFFI